MCIRDRVLRPRRGGWRDAVHPSVHPWQGAADFGRRPTGGGAGVKGAQPPAASFPHFLSAQEMGPPAGAGPGNYAARRAANLRPVSYTHLDVYKRQHLSILKGGRCAAAFFIS